MPELLLDPGFEDPGGGAWSLVGQAAYVQAPDPVQAGLYSMKFTSVRPNPPFGSNASAVFQIIQTVPGKEYIAAGGYWVSPEAASLGANLQFLVDPGPGDGSNLQGWDFWMQPDGLWMPRIHPPFTALGSQVMVYWLLNRPATNGTAYWWGDNFSVPSEGSMRRSRWLALQRMLTVLAGINGGATYHLNLGGRVYPRWIDPRSDAAAFPYLSVPLANDAPTFQHGESGHLEMTWTVWVMGFVADPQAGTVTGSDCSRDALRLGEDVLKALLADPTLNGTVHRMELLDGGQTIAAADQFPWGEVHIPVRLSIIVGGDVLGP